MSKTINVLSVVAQNFRSIKYAEVNFPQEQGLRFLGGINNAEPKLGSNAAGKSSLWNAIFWCLYGSSLYGSKTSKLVTWGEEITQVTVYLRISDTTHEIRRVGPPNKLYIGSSTIPQEQNVLDALLGLSKLRFQHSVIFSQGQRLFPDLAIPERGDLLEEILNLTLWSKCAEAVRTTLDKLSAELGNAQRALATVEGQLSVVETNENLQLKRKEWVDCQVDTLAKLSQQQEWWMMAQRTKIVQAASEEDTWQKNLEAKISKSLATLEEKEAEYNTASSSHNVSPIDTKTRLQEKLSSTRRALMVDQASVRGEEYKLSELGKELAFWQNTKVCSACQQPIQEFHKQARLVQLKEERDKINITQLKVRVNTLNDSIILLEEELVSTQEQSKNYALKVLELKQLAEFIDRVALDVEELLEEQEKNITPYTNQLASLQTEVNPYLSLYESQEKVVNPWDQVIVDTDTKRSTWQARVEEWKKKVEELQGHATQVEYWKHGFKRLRVFLMHRVLSVLELEVNSAANALGLEGWKIALRSETETKSGTVKLGIQIGIAAPGKEEASWDCWSGGETQRLRWALALGVASLIQRASGCWWDIEVFDEPTGALSTEGVESLLESLDYRAEVLKKQLWVVDHIALTFANFKSIWTAVKDIETGTKFVGV